MNTYRALLWFVLAAAVVANITASATGAYVLGSAFGLMAIAAGTALAVNHYRRRPTP